jgi:drug/metabolite transporter (DMT)-like permease
MKAKPSTHTRAVVQALLVTLLWSTSWVLIKFGLKDIPALTFAGLRYSLAFLVLLPFVLRPAQLRVLKSQPAWLWIWLVVLGLLYYTVTQGTQFLSLLYLPAVTVSLLLSFTTVIVAVFGIFTLGEFPTPFQWAGIGLYLLGVSIYFYPFSLPKVQLIGLLIAVISVLANSFSSILGRYVNKDTVLSPTMVTVTSMGVGSLVLLVSGIAIQGLPELSLGNWLLVIWLAVINSAVAFTLWNHTLRTLSAMESSILNNTMLIQIAILAWIFLGESISLLKMAGLLLAAFGTLIVQLRGVKA